MATATIPPVTEYGLGYAWTNRTTDQSTNNGDNNRYYLGQDGSNYRPRFVITIPSDITIATVDKLVIAIKADSNATPKYMRGFLTNVNYTSDWSDITGGTILETSYLWLDTNKTSRATAYQSGGGVTCYLIFNYKFEAGKTYYVHLLPYSSDSSANTSPSFSSTWWRGRNQSGYYSATLYYESGVVKIYTSSGWVNAIPYVYSSGWKQCIPYCYSGGWKISSG